MNLIKELLMPVFYIAAGGLLIFSFSKENKGFYAIGGGFTLLGVWYLIKYFTGDLLSGGFLDYIPKILGILLLLYACYMYIKIKQSSLVNTAVSQSEPVEDITEQAEAEQQEPCESGEDNA